MTTYDKKLLPIMNDKGNYLSRYKTMCFNKYWYETEYEAALSATLLANKLTYRAYKCDYCSGWHLTTRRPNITKKKLRKIEKTKCKTGRRVYLLEKRAKMAIINKVGENHEKCTECGYWHVR